MIHNFLVTYWSYIFAVNCGIAGYFTCYERDNRQTWIDWILFCFQFLIILIFGAPIILIFVIALSALWIYRKTWEYMYLPFIFKYIIFGFPMQYNKEFGDDMHKRCLKKSPKWYQFRMKLFIAIDAWVYKNYGNKG